jgi:hypothetical protein
MLCNALQQQACVVYQRLLHRQVCCSSSQLYSLRCWWSLPATRCTVHRVILLLLLLLLLLLWQLCRCTH